MEKIILDALMLQSDWSTSFAQENIRGYEAFLASASEHDGVLSPPSEDIDLVWHVHMLHPHLYSEYCIKKFGKLIIHNLPNTISENERFSDTTNSLKDMANAGCNGDNKPVLGKIYDMANAGCNAPASD